MKLLSSSGGPSSITVPNSGFETPSLGFGNFQYGPTGGSWSFINGAGISAAGSGFTGGPFIPQGSQVAFIQSNGEFSQSLTGFQANTNYVVTFFAAQRINCCNPGGQQFAVYLDGTLLGTFNPPLNGVYLEYSTGASPPRQGSHTLKFVGLNRGGQAGFIDHVRITGSPVAGNGVQWLVSDHLGTPRMIIDQTGTLETIQRHDYLPFGEELFVGEGGRTAENGYTGGDGVRQQFTQKERDIETGLDYFGARYYVSTQGRFTSVDPSRKSINTSDPQTWNRYTYAKNNPLAYVDHNGKWPTWIHELIIDRALPGLKPWERQWIKDGSWAVDNPLTGGQDTSRSNEHGMTIPGQSQDDAAANADTFINNRVDIAKAAWFNMHFRSGPYSRQRWSLIQFGMAFHTVSDMTSPAHEGYQVWRASDTRSHMAAEASISETIKEIAEELGYFPSRAVKDVVAGSGSREAIPPAERELAAKFYERAAEIVSGPKAAEAKALNLARAKYLREGGDPPVNIHNFEP